MNIVPCSYVATCDVGFKTVYDQRTGDTLDPELVKACRELEKQNMRYHELFDWVKRPVARGRIARSMWVGEMRCKDDVAFVSSRCVAM